MFYISPSKVFGDQSAETVFEQARYFTFEGDDKIKEPEVGCNLVYGDALYMYSGESAADLKNSLLSRTIDHRNSFKNILDENPQLIKKSFNFLTWNQALFSGSDFFTLLGQVEKLYREDEELQKYVRRDHEEIGQREELDEYQLKFFLEEITLFYLVAKKEIQLHNDFLQGKQEWVLNCYPRKPLWSHIYLQQKNPFDLEAEDNKYENCYYDLKNKVLYDFDRVDLETLDL